MAKRRIEVDIVANDQASSVFRNIGTHAAGMSSKLMNALNSTAGAVDSIDKALRVYNASMWRFNSVVSGIARSAGDSIYDFTRDAINNFSMLEHQHAKTMGAMATEYGKTTEAQKKFLEDSEKLKQQALTLGTVGPTGRGALNTVTDVSYAQTALVKSGMSAEDLLNSNAVEAVLKFAGGNDLDIDTATTFAVNLATMFDKPVEQWGEMLDMVTKAADISVIDVPDIMESLKYTGGIASGLGRDLEEVLGVISVMGQAGLRGTMAGTGIQAFFTRILSANELSDKAIGSAPTSYVGNLYNEFVSSSLNPDSSFKNIDEIAESLNTAMSTLNDQEQAWFTKKLFGLYQMKAAYAISGSADGNENLITDFINQIENQSLGTNDIKYNLMLASQYGKVESLRNVWEGIKTDMGDRLSPMVSAVADELFNFLGNNGNYDINWDSLRDAISKSGDLIGEKYGEEIASIIENFADFGVDTAIIGEALTPQFGGLIGGIGKLLNGDISGAIEEFSNGIKDTNTNIDGLPEELQGTASAARNVINMFTTLASINLATQIVQILTSAFNTFIGKPLSWITGKVTSGSTSVSSATSVINVELAQLMNVNANVVNVYGGWNNKSGGKPTGSNPPLLTGPTGNPPLIGGGGLSPLLTGGAGLVIGSTVTKAVQGALGSGMNIAGLLGSGTTTSMAAGKVINMYNVGGTYMSGAQIASTIASKAALGGLTALGSIAAIDLFGSPGLLKSQDKRVQEGSDWLDQYVLSGNKNYGDISNNARVYDWLRNNSNYNGSNRDSLIQAEIRGRTAARDEMMSYYKTGAGADFLNELFATQIEETGKITENFLASITQWTKDGYTYSGSNDDIKEILNFMYANFGSDYKESTLGFAGKFNNSAINKFLSNDPELKEFSSKSQTIIENTQGVIDATQGVIDAVNNAMDRVQSPNISVNVNTKVDKSGNVTTDVDVSKASREIARRASQYGATNVLN